MEQRLALPLSPASAVRERSGSPGYRQLGSPSPGHQRPSEGTRRLLGQKALPCPTPGITARQTAPQPSRPGEGQGDRADDPLVRRRRAVSSARLREDQHTDTLGHTASQKQMEPPGIRALPRTGEGLLRAGSALGSHVNGRHPDAAMRAQRHTHTHTPGPLQLSPPGRASHTQSRQKFRLVGTFTSTVPAAFKSSKKINTAPPQLSSLPGAPKLQVQPAAPPKRHPPRRQAPCSLGGPCLMQGPSPPHHGVQARLRTDGEPPRAGPSLSPSDDPTTPTPQLCLAGVTAAEPGGSRRRGQGTRRPAPASSQGSAPAPPKENTEARQREAGGWVVQTRRPSRSTPGGQPPLPASGRVQWGGAGQRCPAPGLHPWAWRGPLLPPWGLRHTRGPRRSPTDPWVPVSDHLAGPSSPAPAHRERHCPPTSRLPDSPGGLGAHRSWLAKHPAHAWADPSPELSPPHQSPSRRSRDPRDRQGSPRPHVRPDLSPRACPS